MELYVFDSRLKKMKTGLTNQNIVEAHEVTQINTAGQLTFTTTIKSDVDEKIETTDIVFVKVKDDRYHPYKIVQSNMPTPNTIQYTCIEYAYYLFAKDGLVHDKRPDNWTIQKTVFEVIKGTHWQVGYVDPNLPTVTSSFYWITRTECFKKIAELTGAEFEFYMTMSNNKITSRTIEAYKQRGTDTHQRFVYGMNALEVVAEEDATNAVTKIYPRGSGEMYTSEGDGGRKLTISDVVWSKASGDPTDKPKGQDYLVYGSSTYDLDNGNQPSSIVEFQDEKDENNLIWRAFDWLKQNNRPKVQFKAKVSKVGDLKLGDRVVIDREDLGIKYVTRVFKLDRNLLNEKLNTIELGDIVAHTLADAINNVADGVANINNRVNDVTSTLIDGQGNTVTYGADEPSTKKKGDVWYKPSDIVEGIQQYDVYVWDGEKWVLTIGNQIQNELVAKVEQAQKDTAEAQKQAQAASDKATQIEKDFTTSIGDIKADVQSVETSAQNAMSQAQKAIDKANFNDTAITDIKNQQSADGQRLTTVESNYNGLNQTVKDNAAKQESDRAQLSGLISDKVSNSEFDSFKVQTADKMANIITNTNNLFVNSSMEDLPLDQTFQWIDHPEKVAIIDNPFKDFKKIENVVIKDGFSYVNNKSPKVLKIQIGGKVTAPGFKVTGGTRFYMEFDFYSNTGSGWLLGVLQHGENGWWSSGGPYTYRTFDQDKWCHWRGYFDLEPQCTSVDFSFNPVGGTEDSITYFDNIVCTKANIMTSMIQQTQNDITSLVQNTDSLNKRIQTAETTVESIENMNGSNTLINTVKGQQQKIEDISGNVSSVSQTVDLIRDEVRDFESNTTSRLDVMNGNINAKVDKDGVITQINVSPENILIDGKKIHITGLTTIDNAVIDSSMIKEVSANKVTAGTLDARNVKIVNLDVNTLAGNKSKFLQTIWEDTDSYSEITSDGLTFYESGTPEELLKKDAYLNIHARTMKWSKKSLPEYHYISQTTEMNYCTLKIGAVQNGGDVNPAITVRTDGYNNAVFADKSSAVSGEYLFLGSMTPGVGSTTDGQGAAYGELTTSIPGESGSMRCYRIKAAAENDIELCLASNGSVFPSSGTGIRFSYHGSCDYNETAVVFQKDNGCGMVLRSKPTYNRTYSSSANLFITENGYIGRSTSARKYKQNIEYIDNVDEAKKTLAIQPAEWADRKQVMSHARTRAGISKPEDEERLSRRYIGFIADDFAEAGFEKLIVRDKTGEVEEFQYSRLSVYHHQMIKDLYNQIKILKEEIKKIKGDI